MSWLPDLDSIAVSLFGNKTVETGEVLIITKECIRTKDLWWSEVSEQKIQIIILDTETGTLSSQIPWSKLRQLET